MVMTPGLHIQNIAFCSIEFRREEITDWMQVSAKKIVIFTYRLFLLYIIWENAFNETARMLQFFKGRGFRTKEVKKILFKTFFLYIFES